MEGLTPQAFCASVTENVNLYVIRLGIKNNKYI